MNRKIIRVLLICCFAFSGLLFRPDVSLACSCAGPPPLTEDLNRKTAVFAGKVIRMETPTKLFIRSSADPVEVTFEVSTVWKGELKSKTIVYTALDSASCGYEGFEVNKEYLVFAYGTPDRLGTGICERTKPLSAATQELQQLGLGQSPPLELKEEKQLFTPGTATMMLTLVILLATILGFIRIKRRKSRKRP